VSNAKPFFHLDLKLSLPSHARVAAARKFNLRLPTRFNLEHAICARATIESEALAPISSSESQIGADYNFGAAQDVSQENSDVDEREELRRSRISNANKGDIPWNEGQKHSPGWITRIFTKEKTAHSFSIVILKRSLYSCGIPWYQLYLHEYQ
jgi:hypothetical protein